MGTIQDRLCALSLFPSGTGHPRMLTLRGPLYSDPNKEITRSILRTGHWESFIRSLDHELKSMASKTRTVLSRSVTRKEALVAADLRSSAEQGNVESTLLQIEIDYVRLYGNAIALRALQERLRRRVKVCSTPLPRACLLSVI